MRITRNFVVLVQERDEQHGCTAEQGFQAAVGHPATKIPRAPLMTMLPAVARMPIAPRRVGRARRVVFPCERPSRRRAPGPTSTAASGPLARRRAPQSPLLDSTASSETPRRPRWRARRRATGWRCTRAAGYKAAQVWSQNQVAIPAWRAALLRASIGRPCRRYFAGSRTDVVPARNSPVPPIEHRRSRSRLAVRRVFRRVPFTTTSATIGVDCDDKPARRAA